MMSAKNRLIVTAVCSESRMCNGGVNHARGLQPTFCHAVVLPSPLMIFGFHDVFVFVFVFFNKCRLLERCGTLARFMDAV